MVKADFMSELLDFAHYAGVVAVLAGVKVHCGAGSHFGEPLGESKCVLGPALDIESERDRVGKVDVVALQKLRDGERFARLQDLVVFGDKST